jgi:hypothetical protein
MRHVRSLALLACLTSSATAVAQESPPVADEAPGVAVDAAETAEAPVADAAVITAVDTGPAAPAAPRSLPWLGIMADVGVPDGMQGSLVLRPWRALRASVGGGYNMISKGVRVGVTLLPFGRGPSGTLEVGRYFEGNGNAAAAQFLGAGVSDSFLGPAFQRVGYDFVNAHLGLDFGYKRATFYIHGGMSYVEGKVHNIDQVINHTTPMINGQDANGLEISVPQGATVKYIGPSGKIGLIVYFG